MEGDADGNPALVLMANVLKARLPVMSSPRTSERNWRFRLCRFAVKESPSSFPIRRTGVTVSCMRTAGIHQWVPQRKRAHVASCPQPRTGRVRRWKQRWEFGAEASLCEDEHLQGASFNRLITSQVQVQGKHRSALPGFWWEPAGGRI